MRGDKSVILAVTMTTARKWQCSQQEVTTATAGLWKPNFLQRKTYYPGSTVYTFLSPESNRHKNTFWRIPNGKDKTARQTRWRTQTERIEAVWVQEIESGCLLQNCVVVMLLVPHHQHCITHTAPATPNYLTVLINAIRTKVNGYVQVQLPVLKVYLRAVNTTDYKTDIWMFDIQFIYTPLHVLICRDHHQVV